VYLDLARGGVGTIITGYAFVTENEQPIPGMMGIYSDCFIKEYSELTDMVRTEGANIVMQIVYGGSASSFNTGGRVIWGPSAIPHPAFKTIPQEMTKDDIDSLISAFAKAAVRCKKAGFTGVQLHAAHSYLLSQFLSPYFNRRRDLYGGSIKNRARLIFEVVEAVRKEVGPNYPVFIKMHCTDDWGENGLTVDESLFVAKGLEQRGINGIEFSGGNLDGENYPNMGPIRMKIFQKEKQSYFINQTSAIAEQLNIPVISVGGHRDPELLEEILNSTNIGYFSLARPLLSEPDLVNRWQGGDRGKLRCVACNKCLADNGGIGCILDRKKQATRK